MPADGSVVIQITGDDKDFKQKVGGLGGVAKAAMAGVGIAAAAGAAAIAALGKQCIDAFSDYEQLVGGVETLFKDSAGTVEAYAANAYKTAGLSANAYMETVTGFSASLLQSLGGDTAAAAAAADVAITDMADNANKMGTSMESIQYAYQGFAKQNYTMLDNLKLGYGGTKSEMERLLADATALSGVSYDLSNLADVYEAIHVVQTELGITGTTAQEASSTIQGSASAMKSAWANLLTGMADPKQDMDALLGNLIDSVVTFAGNLIPRIQVMLPRLTAGIAALAQSLLPYIPEIITSMLPALLDGVTELLSGVTSILPELIETAVQAVPVLVAAAIEIVGKLFEALVTAAPLIVDAGLQLIAQLTNGIQSAIPYMVAKLPEIITGFIKFCTENVPKIMEAGFALLIALVDGIIASIPALVAALPEVIKCYVEYFTTAFPTILRLGGELLGHLIAGLLGAIPEIALKLPEVLRAICEALRAGWEELKNAGRYLLEGLWAGISDRVDWLKGKVSGVIDTIKGWFTGREGFDEHSPSKWSESVGDYMMQGLAIGMENGKGKVMETVADVVKEVKTRFSALTDALETRQDIGELRLKLWGMTDGKDATELEKYEKRLALLGEQQLDQNAIIETAESAYQAVVDQYGENSAESQEYQKVILQEQIRYEELAAAIREALDAKQELAGAFSQQAEEAVETETGRVATRSGTLVRARAELKTVEAGESSAMTGYAVSAASAGERKKDVILQVNGREFARATLEDYRSVEDANPRVVDDV